MATRLDTVRTVREERAPGAIPLFVHPEWSTRFDWIAQGTTGRGDDDTFDLRLFGDTPAGEVIDRWLAVRTAAGFARIAHARQVHGADLLHHENGPPGLLISERFDGHVTSTPGVLLAVSIADCVPVCVVAEDVRAIALLHAGWRGAAAGILEAGVGALQALGADAGSLHVHLGPAICGRCYEVGPEVFEALEQPAPTSPAPIDLRAIIATRAQQLGVPADQITTSELCTRCNNDMFFSHRGGDPQRQMGVLGIRT